MQFKCTMTSIFPIILVRSLKNIDHFCPEAEGNCASGHIGARNYIVQLPTSTPFDINPTNRGR